MSDPPCSLGVQPRRLHLVIDLPQDDLETIDEVMAMYQGPKTRLYDALVGLLADAQKYADERGLAWDSLVDDAREERESIATSSGRG
jgi:hypothetical protein